MNTHIDTASENKSQAVANSLPKLQLNGESPFPFVDNRPQAIAQRKLQDMANNSPRVQQLRAYQEMANKGSKVDQPSAYRAMANDLNAQVPQQKELLPGEFESVQKKKIILTYPTT